MASPPLVQWVLDTRPLWPQASQTRDLAHVASRAMALVPAADRAAVLRYYHARDAKMALGSALLKRYAIARLSRPAVAWPAATATRDGHGKPVFRPCPSEPGAIEFNVSHQAGLVVLVGTATPGAALGVDVVSPAERRARDHATVRADGGWPAFVDMHADVLGAGEVAALRALRPHSEAQVDAALRRFYALWCLREAYVKMTGEALLAPWLGHLEMRGFAPPEDMAGRPYEAWFRGERVRGVDVRLEPLLGEYMVSTVVRTGEDGRGLELGEFESLDINDVLDFAEKSTA